MSSANMMPLVASLVTVFDDTQSARREKEQARRWRTDDVVIHKVRHVHMVLPRDQVCPAVRLMHFNDLACL